MIVKLTSMSNSMAYIIQCTGVYAFIKTPGNIRATVKPVLSSHSKIDKTNVLKTNSSLIKVKIIAECSLGAFCNTFGLH